MNEQNGPVAPLADGAAPGGGGLQFERAEFAAQEARKCFSCRSEIRGDYFTINGNVACAACHGRVAEHREGGPDVRRFIRAAIFGGIAAALGCAIYCAMLALTDSQWGIIAILVGWMVGKAVSNGSRRRGGWLYQLLAVCLTYTAVVSSYVPLIISSVEKKRSLRAASVAKSDATKTPVAKTTEAKAAASDVAAGKAAAEAGPAGEEKGPKEAAPMSTGRGLLLALILFIPFLFILPILAGFKSPLLLVIIGIGLYEAWKLNKRVVPDIKGPFHVASPSPEEASPSGA